MASTNKNQKIKGSRSRKAIAGFGIIYTIVISALIIGMLLNTYWAKEIIKVDAEADAVRDEVLPTVRGTIYDSRMNVLAQSSIEYTCFLDAGAIKDNLQRARDNDARIAESEESFLQRVYKAVFNRKKEERDPNASEKLYLSNLEALYERLESELGVDRELIMSKVNETDPKKMGYGVISTKVSAEQRREIIALDDELRASETTSRSPYFGVLSVVGFDEFSKRYYPQGDFASQLIGFKQKNGYALGLESYYDEVLDGTYGRSVSYRNGMGTISSSFSSVNNAVSGSNLVLTIDPTIQDILQEACNKAYEDYSATYTCAIAMEVKTGKVLGMALTPTFDLNNNSDDSLRTYADRYNRFVSKDWQKLKEFQGVQMIWNNRALTSQGYLQPGSVFKMFLVSAALDEGVWSDGEEFYCGGSKTFGEGNGSRTYRCYHNTAHHNETIDMLLPNSCNLFSIELAERLGAEKFFDYYEAFGFTEPTGIDTATEADPKPSDELKEEYNQYFDPSVYFDESNLRGPAFGETIYITPLQIITAASAIANDGVLMKPYVVDRTLDDDGNIVSRTEPTEVRRVISSETSATVREYLRDVTISGNGQAANIPGYRVAVKTGTAVYSDTDQVMASAVGFAPADDPEIAILIDIYEPQAADGNTSASTVALPMFRRIMEPTVKYLNIEPVYTEEELADRSVQCPNVVGKTTEEAARSAENKGLELKVEGSGDVIVAQTPGAGTELQTGGVVYAYTDSYPVKTQVEVPNFAGMSSGDVLSYASYVGLNINIVGGIPDKASVSEQSISPGEFVDAGTVVEVSFRSWGYVNTD